MNENILKRILYVFVLIILLIPVAAFYLCSVEEKRENRLIFEQERITDEIKEKIYLLGKFDPRQRKDFVFVSPEYTIDGIGKYLRKETFDAFLKMQDAAENEGVSLKLVSATRNFDYQKGIWEDKWNGVTLVDGEDLSKSVPDGTERFKKILEFSAAPGTSRHHWGTDIDINGVNPPYFQSGKGIKEYAWLVKNAGSYGFCQTYNEKGTDRVTGYNEEKWHWSYLPLAKNFLSEYKGIISDDDINGFDGDEYASKLDLINDYVLSINPDCK